jgi:GT2 family glycosyltransferase
LIPLVSVIIVSYNAKHFLPDCLGSLTRGTYKNIEIIFVDNASKDGTVAYLKKNYPKIKLIQNASNLGFSPANKGILKEVKGDAVLLLNTDTILAKNLLEELVKNLFAKKTIGAVQPKILMFPQKGKIDSIGSFFLLNGMLYHVGYEKDETMPIYNKQAEIFSTKGAIMLIKKEVLDKVVLPFPTKEEENIFDNDYFTAFEETDLCMRIWLAGYKILYITSVRSYHIGGGTVKKLVQSVVIFHSEKNRLASYIKNLSLEYLVKVLPRLFIMLQLEFMAYLLIRRRVSIAFAVQKSILWNIVNIGQTLRKRRYIQTYIRSVKDSEFLPKLIKPVRLSYYYYLLTGLQSYQD